MTAEDGNDGTDTSSIKPVSSLRSRFENLNVDHAKRPVSPSRPSSRLSQLFQPPSEPQLIARSSLDVARPPYAQTPRGLSDTQELGNGTDITGVPSSLTQDVLSRYRPRTGPLPSRPGSIGPASPPAAPSLLIQSPQSPPRLAFDVVNGESTPSSPPRPRSVGEVSDQFIPLSVNSEKSEISENQAVDTLGKRVTKPPPPVNRASKPLLTPSPVQATLSPQAFKFENVTASPFNTPPESPSGSPTKGSPVKSSNFPPPPVHHQVQARRQSRALGQDPAISNERSIFYDPSDEPDQRPTLPVRNGNGEATRPAYRTPHGPVPNRGPYINLDPSNLYSPSPRRTPEAMLPPQPPEPRRKSSRTQPPPRPSEESKEGRKSRASTQAQTFLPPPKRVLPTNGSHMAQAALATSSAEALGMPQRSLSQRRDVSPRQQIRRVDTDDSEMSDAFIPDKPSSDYPDFTQANRRPPRSKYGTDKVWTHYDTRLMDIYGRTVCTSGYITRAWDVTTGKAILDMTRDEREVKILSMVFKPAASADEEGQVIWLGDNYGEIQEVDIGYHRIMAHRPGAHGRCEIIKMHRYQNTVLSMDSEGRLLVWLPNDRGVPDLDVSPNSHRVAKGHTFSIIAVDKLWHATGRELRVYDPMSGHERTFHIVQQPMSQPGTGEITSGTVLPTQLDRVYFGHSDGKVSVYSTGSYNCLSVINVSTYKITTMAGVGSYIWAGFSTGHIYVYDMKHKPWKVRKEWKAHDNPVASIIVDRSSVWKFGHLQVASLGLDNAIRLWDGMLEDDWVENEMHEKDLEYCQFQEIKAVIVTWNAGASTPSDIRYDQKDENFFREVVQPNDPPEIIVFAFQELVDLEDKSLTAKTLFKSRHKHKSNQDPDHMGHQYRAWRDFLARNLVDSMPVEESYTLVKTGNLVGLFSCIFVRSPLQKRIREVEVAEIKRGMGGLYGNKGAIVIRLIFDSTSLCFVNCHLAAGQKETLSRNNDATAILESTDLMQIRDGSDRINSFTGGGDGTMIMDHEICILNGDLNYRIDTMSRDSVVKTIKAGNLERLLDRDQLLLSRRRNPAFKLRNFKEDKITFAPTYKYDVRTDRYDSSEKNRSPAWCDRILYRGQGRIKMLEYRRHECWASDHRPVSGTFMMRVKQIDPELRNRTWNEVQSRLVGMKMAIAETIRLDYLVNVLGVEPSHARNLAENP